ncbi:uncharacterized protein LOC144763625 [Lissotriton helveticus]
MSPYHIHKEKSLGTSEEVSTPIFTTMCNQDGASLLLITPVASDTHSSCHYATNHRRILADGIDGRLQWTEEGLRQEGAGNRKKEEPAAVPVKANEGLEIAGAPAPKDLFSGRLQWTEEGLRQEGAGNRKKEEPAAAPVEANEVLERAGVPAPKDMFSGSRGAP